MEGVSFVVPVHNGVAWIRDTLEAILSQADGRPMEIVVVDDRSRDGSAELLKQLAEQWPLRIVSGAGRGAAAAINLGLRLARFPIICQVDQDVTLGPGWMRQLVDELEDPAVAAAQGYFASDPGATWCARAMGVDLEQRYAAIEGPEVDQVCTGNAMYRAESLRRVGLFDETLGYGYDNDITYRLRAAGYHVRFCRGALSTHRWREGLAGYLVQQYGFGYGRLDLVAKHPGRFAGDSVSPPRMMAHPLLMLVAVVCLATAGLASLAGGASRPFVVGAALVLSALATERLVAGVRAGRRFRDWAPLTFPILHLVRDLAWVAAIIAWSTRRMVGRPMKPSHSMRPRPVCALPSIVGRRPVPARAARILCLIPAHNEAATLAAVVSDVRMRQPHLDLLVVDDGSTDSTPSLLERLDVRWLRLPERMGIGSAMRAGLRFAVRLDYDAVVRMDGDGQHSAEDVDRLLDPVVNGTADVVLGSRFTGRKRRAGLARFPHQALATCLSLLTRRLVTDPTSGFCAIGRRAVRVLAEHHPTGYPEPELRLFLSRNALNVVEVPIHARPRLGGRTSLTAGRVTTAGARVVLAMLIVPFRCRVEGPAGD